MRFLLRPGWLALIAAVLAFVVACYTFLAPWQFGREAQRESQQAAIAAADATPPAPLPDMITPELEWRQVSVTGTYDAERQGLVRLRGVAGRPAVEVLTPFTTTDGRVLVVDRGTVATTSGAVTPPIAPPPPGEVTITARLRLDRPDPEARVLDEAGYAQLYSPDSPLLATALDLPLEPGWLQLAAGQPGVLDPLPVEPDSSGAPFTNLSYALQWITFGVVALVALGYFIRLELLQRSGRKLDRTALRRALAGDD